MFRWMWMACLLPGKLLSISYRARKIFFIITQYFFILVFLSIFLSTLDYHLVCLIISGSNCVLASLCSNLLTDYIYIQLGIQIPDIPPQPISDQDVIFSYLTNANRTPRLIIGGQVVTNLFQPNKKSIFIIHGSQGSSSDTWIKEMSHNIFDVEDCQIVWVDWEKFSKLSHTEAAMYSREVGRVVGSFIINHNIPPASIHFISHSMGGHISGFAGKLVFSNTGNKIGRISAMDLGGNQFINKGENDRLAKNDAVMVDHVHTDGGAYGYDRPDFKVDLFANGGVKFQPGCPIYVGLPATLTEAIKEICK